MFDFNKKEKPFTSFSGFGGGGLGLAGGAIKLPTYVDDVFSTFLYEGNGSAQTIRNGINLGTAFGGNSYDFRGQTSMSKNGALSGAAGSKTFTISFWFYPRSSTTGHLYAEPAGPNISFGSNTLTFDGFNSSYNTILAFSTTALSVGNWYHVLFSFDLADSSKRHLYVNDVATSGTYYTYNNQNIANNVSGSRYVGSVNGSSNKFDGNIAHLYYDTTYRDLSTTSNRRLFVTAGLEPATGQASLNPLLYLPLNAATGAATNLGTGGNFTATTGPFFDEGFGPGTSTSAEGGLVWIKNREISASDHIFTDTERGTNTVLESNRARVAQSKTDMITSFTSTGFAVADNGNVNENNDGHCAWTFRKAPGFFDVVTWSGNSTAGRTIPHNLGSVPGAIWVKNLNVARDWCCYHRGVDASNPSHYKMNLNKTDARADEANIWNDTEPTSTVFTVGSDGEVNANGETYVAYIFAHDDQSFGTDGDESIIKCGSYTGTGSANFVNLGFEPQFIIIKRSSGTEDWLMFDNMRGMVSGGIDPDLRPNQNQQEGQFLNYFNPNSNGFTLIDNNNRSNNSGDTYIYIAIRRPHKPPEAGIDVFKPELLTSLTQTSTPGFAPDLVWQKPDRNTSYHAFFLGSRLTGNGKYLQTYSSSAEGSFTSWEFDAPTGKFSQTLTTGSTSGGIQYFFKRAAGFFDVVTYTGTGSTNIINHNLGVVPELQIVKSRSTSDNLIVYTSKIDGSNDYLFLNNNNAVDNSSQSVPSDTAFTFTGSSSLVNGSGTNYISYLFATVSGISKVGTFSGTGSDINVDCGFTAGARFVFIKRTDSSGDWYQWDSARGIVAGNDPYLLINSAAAEVTNTDYIDPLNAGFTVTSSAPAAINTSGGTYLFLAIA